MDLRQSVLGILVGGAPAPGINGIIASVTIEAINQGLMVIGFYEGFKRLRQGKSLVERLEMATVTKIQNQGGSYLRTSKHMLNTPEEVDNCLRVLEHHRIRYLVTLGGTDTAYSSLLVASAAKKAQFPLSVVHVPKTIFNDLPLPEDTRTFGFSTARHVGMTLVNNLQQDARTMLRFYILVVMGAKAGHLALGIGKAAAGTLTVIPEEFKEKKLSFSGLCDLVEATIHKRRAMEKEYGVIVLAEGLVDKMDAKEVTERFGSLDIGHARLGDHISAELVSRFKARKQEVTVVARNLGVELRAADPDAEDIVLTRDLGFGAVHFLLEGGSGALITFKDGAVLPLPLSDLLDPATGLTRVREVDLTSMSYKVAQHYMIKLTKDDLNDLDFLDKISTAAGMPPAEFAHRFVHVAEDRKRFEPRDVSRPTPLSTSSGAPTPQIQSPRMEESTPATPGAQILGDDDE